MDSAHACTRVYLQDTRAYDIRVRSLPCTLHAHTCTCTRAVTHPCMCTVCSHACTRMCLHVQTVTLPYVRTYEFTDTHAHTCTHVCTRPSVHTHVCTRWLTRHTRVCTRTRASIRSPTRTAHTQVPAHTDAQQRSRLHTHSAHTCTQRTRAHVGHGGNAAESELLDAGQIYAFSAFSQL